MLNAKDSNNEKGNFIKPRPILNYLNLNYRVFNYTIDGGKID